MDKLKETIKKTITDGTFVRAVLSGCSDRSVKRVTYTPLRGGVETVQAEKLTSDGKAFHKNIAADDAADVICSSFDAFRQLNVLMSGCEAEALRSKKGAVHISYRTAARTPELRRSDSTDKNYILKPGVPYDFLTALGIQDANGRVHDKRQNKFRQINRFLQIVCDVEHILPKDDLCIWDLCCGKSYLSFAAYYYFTYIRGFKTEVWCVDRKADVIEDCSLIASSLGWTGMKFICGDVTVSLPERKPDLVLSLHACDTATDVVLAEAVIHGAKAVLSSPCCQHELASQLNCPDLEFITREPYLKQKLSAILTDALRCRLLYACGYKVTTLEFIDPEETPKNMMIRAEAAKIPEKLRSAALDEYNALCLRLGVSPTMKALLANYLQ